MIGLLEEKYVRTEMITSLDLIKSHGSSKFNMKYLLDSNGGVISTQEIPHICPCYLNCDDEAPTKTTNNPTDPTTKVGHLQTDDMLTSVLPLPTTSSQESSTSLRTASSTEKPDLKTVPISESSVKPLASDISLTPDVTSSPPYASTPGLKIEQKESITSDSTMTHELKTQITPEAETSTKSVDPTLLETSLVTSTFQPTQQESSTPTTSEKLQTNLSINLLSTQVTFNKEEANPTTEQNSLPNEAQTSKHCS